MFPFDDIGGDQNGQRFRENFSYQAIIEAVQLSGYYGPDPFVRDTSDLRDFSQGFSYHFTGNAVDFGDDQPNGSPEQTGLAAWIWYHYRPYTLELIHLNSDDSQFFAVKNGQDVGYEYYGDATMQAHRNHVHWAITKEGLAQVVMAGFNLNINTNGPLNMIDPAVRTAQGLLEARGGMIKPDNVSHPAFSTVTRWFQGQAGLTVDGIIGATTSQRLLQSLKGK